MKRYAFFFLLALLWVGTVGPAVWGQAGDRHVYDFLTLSPSARLTALGGINVSLRDHDPHMAVVNPGLLTDSMDRQVALSFSNYLGGVNYGYAGYARHAAGIGTFHGGVQFVNYGQMQGADEFGNPTGEFQAIDLAVTAGVARSFGDYQAGVNVKFISQTLASGFTSLGVAMDMGASYASPGKLFMAGFALRNFGTQLTKYSGVADREPLPFEIVAGVSNKLRYMPLRLSVTLTHLEQPNLLFRDPNAPQQVDLSGNVIPPPSLTLDRIFSHVVVGGEFLLGDAVRLRGGYNHLHRYELRAENRGGFTGFSLGFGLRIKRLAFDYGFSSYGLNGVFHAHQFSLLVNLQPKEGAAGE